MKLLSILIPSLFDRRKNLNRCLDMIVQKAGSSYRDIEILTSITDYDISTGEKRNQLLGAAKGKYVVSIDDDDTITDNYFPRIMEALNRFNPDAVGFQIGELLDGEPNGISLCSQRYHCWMRFGKLRVRPITHIQPVRTRIAQLCPFPDQYISEDVEWSMNLHTAIKTEHYIDDILYYHHK